MEQSVIDILEEIEQTQGKNAKRDVLFRNRHNDLLKRVFADVGNPYRTYGISKFKMPPPVTNPHPSAVAAGFYGASMEDNIIKRLHEMFDKLATRELTGNAAKAAAIEMFDGMTPREQKWAMRMLLKNLRCGASEGSVEATWPGLVPKFEVALAETLKYHYDENHKIVIDTKLVYPCRVEPKLDGLRMVAIKKDGEVTLYKRSGNLHEDNPTIAKELERFMPDNTVFDGEVLDRSGKFQETTKKKNTDEDKLFYVFDVVSLEEWESKSFKVTFRYRRARLEEMRTRDLIKAEHILVVDNWMAKNEEELLKLYVDALEMGHEGVMLKTEGGYYEPDRSDNIIKFKPIKTFEGTVVGSYLGGRGTKRADLFGGFYVVFENGIVTRVGGGFKDVDKAQIQLEGSDTYNGRIVEVEGQPDPFTDKGFTVDGKVRFPVFCRYRDIEDVARDVVEAGQKYLAMHTS